ncbi:MAG TPA: SpoIIE family protein phosphatase [Terracidiphilus sp.]|nr:SpoIIE family protein phosphatase [Terracidiphilus sp.]
MATQDVAFLHRQLEDRKQRLEEAIAVAPQNSDLGALLRQVDSALERMSSGTYGLCKECHETIERDRLLADPLICYCLDHLTELQRKALQSDLDLAAQVQRNLLPPSGLRANGWETSFHYAPLGPVSGDYCDLIPSEGGLFFVLGDVSGKGVAASMLMTQLHALFRSLTRMSLTLDEIVVLANRVFCESALAGHYATLICGQARPGGEVEIFNAGHLPAVALQRRGVAQIESTGLPLGMFCEVSVSRTELHLDPGDLLFLFTDGFSEARRKDEEYGMERIANLLRQQEGKCPAEVISACVHDLESFAEGPRFDDVTLLAIQRAHGHRAA